MKILLAVPTYESITPETFQSIYDVDKSGHDVDFRFVKGYDCATARNEIAKMAVDGGYDFVLMVDSDIVIPVNALKCLTENPVDITIGLYPKKNTGDGCIELFKDMDGDFTELWYFSQLPQGPRISVKGGGFGCVLIRTECFKKMAFPWFRFVQYANGSKLSEDLYFCDVAKKEGMKIEADTRVRCSHLVRRFQKE